MEYKNKFEDFFYESTASTLEYMIMTGGQVIFQGKAVKSPSQPVLRINVAQRIRDYLQNEMPDFRELDGVVVPHPDALVNFDVCDLYGNVLETFKVLMDYTAPFTGDDMILSEPVNGHADMRMKLFVSLYTARVIENLEMQFDVNMPFNIDYEGYVYNIHYTANTDFTFSYVGGDWLTAYIIGDTIVVTVQENESPDERTGSLRFTYIGTDFQEHTLSYDIVQGTDSINYLVFDVLTGGTIGWVGMANGSAYYGIKYSRDSGETWTSFTKNNSAITCSAGESIYFKKGDYTSYPEYVGHFFGRAGSVTISSATINIKGKASALLIDNTKPEYFAELFHSMSVIDASRLKLPSGDLTRRCFYNMFRGCNKLVAVPKLNAVDMAESCYESMFEGCTSLVNAPDLPATTLVDKCYLGMFKGCTSLVEAPSISALTTADRSCESMFQGCTSLSSVTCLATDLSGYAPFNNWLSHVSASGTFTKKAGVSWTIGGSGIPSGWTVVEV